MFYKDEVLNSLAETGNVAQFVSFSPAKEQRFSRICSYAPNQKFSSPSNAITSLLNNSPEKAVSIRTFLPDRPQGNPFVLKVESIDDIIKYITDFTDKSYYVIVNESLDANDGGVSGVFQGGCAEFAPGVTPRFVEQSGDNQVLPTRIAIEMLNIVYKADVDWKDFSDNTMRYEFSYHPRPRGYLQKKITLWERQQNKIIIEPRYQWPCAYSKYIGDKAYGLLLAHVFGFLVPKTTVYIRNNKIEPFTFGSETGTDKKWTRTCPSIPTPGKYSTVRDIAVPWAIMDKDDPDRQNITSCIIQDEVASEYSGSLISDKNGDTIVEGVKGFGDTFMMGGTPIQLPSKVIAEVFKLEIKLSTIFGSVDFEWAYDGGRIWLLQLHRSSNQGYGNVIVEGNPDDWFIFDVKNGLEELRKLVIDAKNAGAGIKLEGNPGMTSHVADLLRKNNIPSIIL